MKSDKRCPKIAKTLIVLCSALVSACSPGDFTLAGKWEYKEIDRVKSPAGDTEAVIVQGDAEATTSTVTVVYLLKSGDKVPKEDLEREREIVFAADHVKNLSILWISPGVFDISFDEARIADFRNYWAHPTIRARVVEIRLRPKNPESTLPERDKTPLVF